VPVLTSRFAVPEADAAAAARVVLLGSGGGGGNSTAVGYALSCRAVAACLLLPNLLHMDQYGQPLGVGAPGGLGGGLTPADAAMLLAASAADEGAAAEPGAKDRGVGGAAVAASACLGGAREPGKAAAP